MGDTQVGGNLSVHWLVNADDVDPVDEETYHPKQPAGTEAAGSASTVWITTTISPVAVATTSPSESSFPKTPTGSSPVW